MIKKLIIVFLGFLLISCSHASPQQCQETTIQFSNSFSNFTIAISASIKLSIQNNTSLITVTNIHDSVVNQTQTDMKVTLNSICAESLTGDYFSCNDAFAQPFNFSVDNDLINLAFNFTVSNSQMYSEGFEQFYAGIIDQQSLSFYDGRLYDENNKCFNYVYGDYKLTECCASMTAINVTTLNAPACTKFSSISTIFNNQDNSTYANVNFNYDLQNYNLTMIGRFSGPLDYQPMIVIDDAEGCDQVLNNTLYCGYPLFPSGNKLLIFLSDRSSQNPPIVLINRIIVRDNQTFSDDSTPFTTTNTCQSMTSPYGSTQNIVTNLCCLEFQADNSGLPSSTGSATSTVSLSTSTTSGSTDAMHFNSNLTVAAAAIVTLLMLMIKF